MVVCEVCDGDGVDGLISGAVPDYEFDGESAAVCEVKRYDGTPNCSRAARYSD